MIFDVDMLCLIVSDWILDEFYCGLIVHIKWNQVFERMADFRKEYVNPSCFLSGMSSSNIFSFSRGKSACFFDDQLMAAPETMAVYPEVDLQSLGSPALSASQ